MNIYLESVDLEEIRNAAAAGLADGVAFAHTASESDGSDAHTRDRLEEISREFPRLSSFITLSPAPSFATWLRRERAREGGRIQMGQSLMRIDHASAIDHAGAIDQTGAGE